MLQFSVYLVTRCLFIQTSDGRTISMEDLLERIENLESWKSETEKEIVVLREVVAKQEALIEEQARILESYTDNTSTNEPDIEDSDEHNGINKKNGVSVMDSYISSIRSQNPTKLRRGIRQSR
ncbi:hypothetical protein ACF0H5_023089 [Mactra antiquata]